MGKLITTREAAEILGVKEARVHYLAMKGVLTRQGRQHPGGGVQSRPWTLFDADEVERLRDETRPGAA